MELFIVKTGRDSRSRDVILSLYSALMRPPPGKLHPALGSSAQKGHEPVEVSPEEATEMFRGMKYLSYEESLRELG